MTLKDKLELGLKDDAAFRKDNLPEKEVRGPEDPAGPGRSPVVREEREEREAAKKQPPEAPPATDTPGASDTSDTSDASDASDKA